MKLRMQKMLNKQIKSDKKIEHKRKVIKAQETEERDNEINEMHRLMRQKHMDKRREEYNNDSPRSLSPKNPRSTDGGRSDLPSFDASKFRYEAKD